MVHGVGRIGAFLLLLMVVGLTFAQSSGDASRASRKRPLQKIPLVAPSVPPATPAPVLPLIAQALARTFMTQFVAGDYAAQWPELTLFAQAQWPSPAARAAMLQAKFAGSAQAVSFTVGTPGPPVTTWTPPEDPAQQFSDVILVPVTVVFASPAALAPEGVAGDYQNLDLALLVGSPLTPARVRWGRPVVPSLSVLGEGPAAIDAPVVVPANPPKRAATVPILMYHVVAPLPVLAQWNSAYAYQLEYGLTVTPGQFAAQMALLATRQAHPISLARLADNLLYGLPLPLLPVVITFDDGREGPFQNAVPILVHYGFTATFFVPVGLVGQTVETTGGFNPQTYLTWPQVTALSQGGFAIEGHTLYDNHALWGATPATVQALVAQPAATLEQHTGAPVQFIAYSGVWPYPSAAQAGPAEQQLFTELAAVGFVAGAVDARINSDEESTVMMWQLPRVRMTPNLLPAALLPWLG